MPEYLNPVTKQCTEKILEQMNNSFKNIINTNLICFFTKIKYQNSFIPVMVTNYHIINYLANNNSINIYINNEIHKIEIGKVKYFNSHYDLAIIQIKENNKIYFLQLDEFAYVKDSELYYNKEQIYIINYNKKNDITVSYSIIRNINNTTLIYSKPSFQNNNKMQLIFNLSNNKLIGKYENNSEYNGFLFNILIKEFINDYKNNDKNRKTNKNKWNEINILMNISKNDINNNIYFLDKENKNIKFEELSKNKNIELYINDENYLYKKYFIPKNEGVYNIVLKFNFNLTDCSYMFANCENIVKINFTLFNTEYVTLMTNMFHKCTNLKNINNLLLFDTKNVTDMSDMFSFCENLNSLDLSSFNVKNVKNMSYLFYCCYNLENLTFFSMNTKNVINMDYMFEMCNELKIRPYNVKNNKSINKYPNEIDILVKVEENDVNKEIYFIDNYEGLDFQNYKKHYHDCLKELNDDNTELYFNNTKYKYHKVFTPKNKGEYNIKLKFYVNLTDCSYMFTNCENVIKINFISFNTSLVRKMNNMFLGCFNLKELDLSSFNTRKVTDMSGMFSYCDNLNNLNLSSFDTRNVNNMDGMFSFCENLNKLDLSSFDTKNVTNMKGMFYGCTSLINLDISSFDTKSITKINGIFYNCPDNLYEFNKSKFSKFTKEELIDELDSLDSD